MVKEIEEDKVIIKDMSEDFNSKVATILEEIDLIHHHIIDNKLLIVKLSERIHALYRKLFNKMNTEEKKRQSDLRHKLGKIQLGKHRPTLNSSGIVTRQFFLNPRSFKFYMHLLEKRELHLNQVLERIGLTAKDKKLGRNIF